MIGFDVIVVGPDGLVDDAIREAWMRSGVRLHGPIAPAALDMDLARRSGGILLDLSLPADDLLQLSEDLDERDVPFLYVMPNMPESATAQPYILSTDMAARDAIVEALTRDCQAQEDAGVH
ncbi:hypothetical protein [Rhizobium sp. SSA_523]|uniref:hypothetical protein n=1 Tax=Rhizobium sp. SSA_523 TaxID=2952477 RepID=UPI0020902010|nr:hypothetical protein [Rhizobium sp. SSA_523]MCO5734011.1 hypothetical protein [Rhizobium sp. SSA_523]WKC24653.1 hypothetical protein QTJ18_11485 [Rhizobium sp. SSA_523]